MKIFVSVVAAISCLFFCGCQKGGSISANIAPATLTAVRHTIGHTIVGYDVCFSATATGAKSYSWDFGDGSKSGEANPCHKYADTGLFKVKLTINHDSSLTMYNHVYISKAPIYTHLLSAVRAWRHFTLVYSGKWDTTYLPAASFGFTYIDPANVSIGSDTFTFARSVPQHDSLLYFIRAFTDSTGQTTWKTIDFHHTATGDSIRYSVQDPQLPYEVFVTP
jgi:PKD repeat protein